MTRKIRSTDSSHRHIFQAPICRKLERLARYITQFGGQYTYLPKTDLLPQIFGASISREITTGWATAIGRSRKPD